MSKVNISSNRTTAAVSEVLGTAMLLALAVALFSTLQVMVFAYPVQHSAPSANLVGMIDIDDAGNGNITIQHHGGEPLSLDAEIIITIDGVNEEPFIAGDYLEGATPDDNQLWNIGEKVSCPLDSITNDAHVEVTVIDPKTNTIIMKGTLQGAITV